MRYTFGPLLAVDTSGASLEKAPNLSGGTVWLDFEQTTRLTDLTTISGDAISTVDSDENGWVIFKGPDGEKGPLYVDFGAGPRKVDSGAAEANTNDQPALGPGVVITEYIAPGAVTPDRLDREYLEAFPAGTLGDLLYWDGTAWAPLAKGADDTALTTDSSSPTGLSWRAQLGRRTLAVTIGDGSTTAFPITHGWGHRDVAVQLCSATSPYRDLVAPVMDRTLTSVIVAFGSAPSSNSVRVLLWEI